MLYRAQLCRKCLSLRSVCIFVFCLTMGKFTKKESLKKMNATTTKKRDCGVTINLTRLSKAEYEFYKNSSEIIVQSFDIKISDDEMSIGGEKRCSKDGIFHLKLDKQNTGKIDVHFDRHHDHQTNMESIKINRISEENTTTAKLKMDEMGDNGHPSTSVVDVDKLKKFGLPIKSRSGLDSLEEILLDVDKKTEIVSFPFCLRIYI